MSSDDKAPEEDSRQGQGQDQGQGQGQGQRRSGPSRIRSFVRFINHTERTVDVIWLNHEGFGVLYRTLTPRQAVDVNTFVGHPWIFRDSETGDRLCVQLREVYEPVGWSEHGVPRRRQVFITNKLYSLRDRCLQEVRRLTPANKIHLLDVPREIRTDLTTPNRDVPVDSLYDQVAWSIINIGDRARSAPPSSNINNAGIASSSSSRSSLVQNMANNNNNELTVDRNCNNNNNANVANQNRVVVAVASTSRNEAVRPIQNGLSQVLGAAAAAAAASSSTSAGPSQSATSPGSLGAGLTFPRFGLSGGCMRRFPSATCTVTSSTEDFDGTPSSSSNHSNDAGLLPEQPSTSVSDTETNHADASEAGTSELENHGSVSGLSPDSLSRERNILSMDYNHEQLDSGGVECSSEMDNDSSQPSNVNPSTSRSKDESCILPFKKRRK